MAILTPDQVVKEFQRIKSSRINWEDHWQEVAEFHLPRKAIINTIRTPGDKRHQILLDNTGMNSAEKLAGFLHGLLTNPSIEFFELTSGDVELDKQDDVRKWLQDATRRMHNVLNNSNFQTEVHEMYMDLVLFGTAPMLIVEDDRFIVRFSSKNIRDTFIDESNQGVVNKVYQCFDWTADKIVAEFGEENVGEKVLKAFRENTPEKFKIIHAVYEEDPANPKRRAKKFVSQYVLERFKVNLRVGGFREMPYVAPRWSKTTGEIYGRSPGMTSLPEMKTLNKMMETTIKGAQKVVDPPLQVTDDGVVLPIRTRPGSVNYVRAGADPIKPILNDARIDFGFQAMEDKRTRVRAAFFVDALVLREGPQMTATEVLQRTEESSRLLGPVLGRQQHEFLRPLIDRLFEIMVRKDMFLPFPASLEGRDLDVQYSSLIAKSQRVTESQNILRALEALSPFITLDPGVADNLDGDAALQVIARTFTLPQEIIRDKEEVEAIRQNRAEQEAAATQIAAETQQAETVSKLAGAARESVI
jgi:hypothetical protein